MRREVVILNITRVLFFIKYHIVYTQETA